MGRVGVHLEASASQKHREVASGAPAAVERTSFFPCGHPWTDINTLRRDGIDRCLTCRATEKRQAEEERLKSQFSCGHARSPENTYRFGDRRARCRLCQLERQRLRRQRDPIATRAVDRARRAKNHDRILKLERKRRTKNRLAYLLYWELRLLAIRDGLWTGNAL